MTMVLRKSTVSKPCGSVAARAATAAEGRGSPRDMPTSRERLRTRLRRKAAFLVDTGSASRRAMSADEAERFLWSIEKNDPNAFGLTKLSELRLNDPVDVAARGYSWDATADTGIEGRMTLLTYAAWLGRAWIVRGLLRAGAVPEVGSAGSRESGRTNARRDRVAATSRDSRGASSRAREHGHDEYDVSRTGSLALLFKRLHARYPEAATWLVIAAARARAAGGARLAENARLGDDRKNENENENETPPLCFSRCAFRACRSARPVRPFAFATCRHVACEMCVWEAVAREHGEGFCCPVCDDEKTRGGDATESRTKESVAENKKNDVSQKKKRASRARWLALPAEAPDAACAATEAKPCAENADDDTKNTRDDDASAREPDPPGELSPRKSRRDKKKLPRLGKARRADPVLGLFDAKGARKTFSPLPVASAARRRASKHATREDRTRALLAAASSGDAPTVRAVVDAGVDVECADECGFTPLALAAWRGRLGAARALLAAGADPAAVVAGGVTAARAARANGHADVLRALQDALGETASGDEGFRHKGKTAEARTSAADVGGVSRDASEKKKNEKQKRVKKMQKVSLVHSPSLVSFEDILFSWSLLTVDDEPSQNFHSPHYSIRTDYPYTNTNTNNMFAATQQSVGVSRSSRVVASRCVFSSFSL